MPETLQVFKFQDRDSLTVPARRENFTILQEWLNGIADTLVLTGRDKKQILIACDEIFTNIAAYAYKDEPREGNVEIAVTFAPASRVLQITLSDSGAPFDPLQTAAPDVTQPLSKRKVGGLGLFMVRKMMDNVAYQRQDDRSVLILTKCCAAGDKK